MAKKHVHRRFVMLYIPGITTIVVVVWSGLVVDLVVVDRVIEIVLVVVGIVVVGLGNSASPSASTTELV